VLKYGVHQKLKPSDNLQFCLHNQLFILLCPKTILNSSGSIPGPDFTHPMVSTSPSGASTSPSGASTHLKVFAAILTYSACYKSMTEKKVCNAISVGLTLHCMKIVDFCGIP
jgi:hypothetical protein